MNRNKIYELAQKAGFDTWVLNPSKETMSDTPELLNKFGELIVLECYNRAAGQYHHSGDEWDKGVMAVMNSIEELLGIE